MYKQQADAFLRGRKSTGELMRELGIGGFFLLLLRIKKKLLLSRLFHALENRYSLLMKKHRNRILIPYLRTRDALDVSILKRNMIPLHRMLDNYLKSQEKVWQSHIYAGGYFYQGWDDIGIRGFRETNKRMTAYAIDEYLTPDRYVLDIGCNNGFMTLRIASKVKHVDAVDFNPFIVGIGKEVQNFLGITNVTFIVDDFSKMKFHSKYDVIFSLANHQTGDKNLNLSFREHMEKIHGLLSEGGQLMFESHTPEAKDPNFAKLMESVTDLFQIVKSVRIPQYKLNYIGDRLFYVLARRNYN